MDKLTTYRQHVVALLSEHAAPPSANPELTRQAIFDTERDRYAIVVFGRQHGRYLYAGVLHVDIIDGKIWIQYNASDLEISKELTALGVDSQDIVIGFHPPEVRAYAGYANSRS